MYARRLVARGSGSGGYTTLSLLAFRDILRCGTSVCAVSNLETLVEHAETFEAHYMDQVLGPLPESRQLLQERSPCFHLDGIKRSPVLFIQARLDGQSSQRETEEMMRKLRANGVPTAMLPVEGEPYGPRITADTQKALEAELSFYSQVMGLTLAEPLEPVALEPALPEPPRR